VSVSGDVVNCAQSLACVNYTARWVCEFVTCEDYVKLVTLSRLCEAGSSSRCETD